MFALVLQDVGPDSPATAERCLADGGLGVVRGEPFSSSNLAACWSIAVFEHRQEDGAGR